MITFDRRMIFEEFKFIEDVTTHEHVASAGREFILCISQRDGLLDAILKKRVRHRNFGAALLDVGAEDAF